MRWLPWLPWLPWLRLAWLQVRRLRGLWRLLPVLGTVPLVLSPTTLTAGLTEDAVVGLEAAQAPKRRLRS